MGFITTLLVLTFSYMAYCLAIFLGGYHIVQFIIKQVYPIDVSILEVRGGSMKYKKDFGRIKNKKGIQKLELFKAKKSCPPPRLDYLYPINKRRDYLLVLRDANGNLFPGKVGVSATQNLVDVNPDFYDVDRWAIQEHKDAEEKYNKLSFMEKWGGFIAIIITGVVCFLMVYISVNYLANQNEIFLTKLEGFTDALSTLTNTLAGGVGG